MLVGRYQGAGEQALALWREAGDLMREGDALGNLSRALHPLGRGPDSVAMAEAAVTLLEPHGTSTELARAYACLATVRMLNSEYQAAIDLAVRAQAIAEPLGALDALSDALNTRGCSVAETGGEWTGYLRHALEVALSAGLDEQAARAYANLCGTYGDQRRFAEAERYFAEGITYCDEHEVAYKGAFLRGERAVALERTGRSDETVTLSTELLATGGPAMGCT
jgi:tetratricopeptide (TPR) repeat protein